MLRTQPTDTDLSNFLRARAMLPIHEADVYAADPADLTERFTAAVAGDGTKAWYFFTKLQPKNKGRNRKNRSTDAGVWHDEGKKTDIDAGDTVKARRNLFSFKRKGPKGEKVRSGWIMHEYQLQLQDGNDLVLCKVYAARKAGNEVEEPPEAVMQEEPAAVLLDAVVQEVPEVPPGDDLESLSIALATIFPGRHLY